MGYSTGFAESVLLSANDLGHLAFLSTCKLIHQRAAAAPRAAARRSEARLTPLPNSLSFYFIAHTMQIFVKVRRGAASMTGAQLTASSRLSRR